MLIALVGLIGSGKDTVGRHLVETHGFRDIAFAAALKDALCAIFGWDREMIEGKTPQSRAWRDEVDQWWAEKIGIAEFTPRWAMQNVGTEILRTHLHDGLWIARVEREIEQIQDHLRTTIARAIAQEARLGRTCGLNPDQQASIVVTDGRFPNELDMVRGRGGKIIRVRRGEEPAWYGTAEIANSGIQGYSGDALAKMNQTGVHISEWAWAGYAFDAVVENDGSLDQLFARADAVIGR